LIFDFDLMILI